MAEVVSIPERDVLPVRSRVSWGAIFAGAVVALAVHMILTLLGSAIGLSVSDDLDVADLGMAAAIWATLSTILALFAGGWVTSQAMAGEDKREAAMHGIIMWGVVFFFFMWLVTAGVRTGFNAMVGATYAGGASATGVRDAQAAGPRSAVSPQQTTRGDGAVAAEEVAETAAGVAWWTLLGVALSLAAAIGGAIAGSGPSFRMLGVAYRDIGRGATQRPAGA